MLVVELEGLCRVTTGIPDVKSARPSAAQFSFETALSDSIQPSGGFV